MISTMVVHQDLLSARLRIDVALDVMKKDPDRGEVMFKLVGNQLEAMLEMVRSLATGIHP